MKITVRNYQEQSQNIKWSAIPNALSVAKENFEKSLPYYDKGGLHKENIDKFLMLLNKVIDKMGSDVYSDKQVTKKATDSKPATEKKPRVKRSSARQKENKEVTVKKEALRVGHIESDIALVKKYISLHNKKKTHEQLLSVYRAFSKNVVEDKVNAKSQYLDVIKTMKERLNNALEIAKEKGEVTLSINLADLKRYKEIAESVEKSPSVRLLIEYINITDRKGMKERAKKLVKRMENAITKGLIKGDRYESAVTKALAILNDGLAQKGNIIVAPIQDYQLNGIAEVAVKGYKSPTQLGTTFTRQENAVLTHFIQSGAKNFTAPELTKAFKDVVAPSICKAIIRKMVQAKRISLNLVRNPAKKKVAI